MCVHHVVLKVYMCYPLFLIPFIFFFGPSVSSNHNIFTKYRLLAFSPSLFALIIQTPLSNSIEFTYTTVSLCNCLSMDMKIDFYALTIMNINAVRGRDLCLFLQILL